MQAFDQVPAEDKTPVPPLAVFSPTTEERLQLYFARAGQLDGANDGPSNFAAMCERADKFIHSSRPCPTCDTSGMSKLSPEEFVERVRKTQEEKARGRELIAQAETPKDLVEAELLVARQHEEFQKLMAESAACKDCGGTGFTKPRRIPRGRGDNMLTSGRCGRCAASGRINRPDPWDIRRTIRELEKEAAGYLGTDELVQVARGVGADLQGPDRWTRTLELLRRISYQGLPGARVDGGAAVMVDWDRDEAFRRLRDLMSDVCDRCDGSGYWVPITVRETGSSMQQGGRQPNVSLVREHGGIDRIFARYCLRDPLGASALGTYYGPMGNRWGHWDASLDPLGPRLGIGRIFALWPLTKPGSQLAREAGKRFEKDHGTRLEPHDVLLRELKEDRSSPLVNVRRRALLDHADKAARSLFERAKRGWCQTVFEVHGVSQDPGQALQEMIAEVETADAADAARAGAAETARDSAEVASFASAKATAREGGDGQ